MLLTYMYMHFRQSNTFVTTKIYQNMQDRVRCKISQKQFDTIYIIVIAAVKITLPCKIIRLLHVLLSFFVNSVLDLDQWVSDYQDLNETNMTLRWSSFNFVSNFIDFYVQKIQTGSGMGHFCGDFKCPICDKDIIIKIWNMLSLHLIVHHVFIVNKRPSKLLVWIFFIHYFNALKAFSVHLSYIHVNRCSLWAGQWFDHHIYLIL